MERARTNPWLVDQRAFARACDFAMALCVLGIGGASACSWVERSGERCHLIIGLGVVRTSARCACSAIPAGNGRSVAEVTSVRAAGALIGAGPVINGLFVGWASVQAVSVDAGSEVLVDAQGGAAGLKVRMQTVAESEDGPGREAGEKQP